MNYLWLTFQSMWMNCHRWTSGYQFNRLFVRERTNYRHRVRRFYRPVLEQYRPSPRFCKRNTFKFEWRNEEYSRKRKSAVVSPMGSHPVAVAPAKAATKMSPLIPLVGVVLLLLVLGTAVIFLPPYLLAIRTSRSKTEWQGEISSWSILSPFVSHRLYPGLLEWWQLFGEEHLQLHNGFQRRSLWTT